MVQSKALSKGTSKNKSIQSTGSDNKSSGLITLDKSVQSTNPRKIRTTYNDSTENKSEFQLNGRLNLLFCFIHSSFIDYT